MPNTRLDASLLTQSQAAAIPPIATGYTLYAEPNGRIYLHAKLFGADWYCRPQAWRDLRYYADRGNVATAEPDAEIGALTVNYGLNLSKMPEEQSGVLTTNDPGFGPIALGTSPEGLATSTEQCPGPVCPQPNLPSLPPIGGGNLVPLALLAAGLFVLLGLRRRN